MTINTSTINASASATDANTSNQTTTQAATPVATEGNTQQTQTPTIDMEAIAAKAAEIAAKKENAVMKSFFEQNGLSKEEAEKAIAEFKAQKAKQEEADKNDAAKQIKKAQDELATLKAELAKERYDKNIAEICKECDVKEGREQFVLKFVNQSDVMKDGTFDKEAAKKSINAILEALPEFKKTQQTEQAPQPQVQVGGAIKIGAQAPAQTPNQTTTMTSHQKFAAYIAANKK